MSRLVSPTQRKALEVLAQGGRIIVVRHNGRDGTDTAFLYKKQGEHLPISTATVEVLRVQGWLRDTKGLGYLWRASDYVISVKGRSQLRKEREADAKNAGEAGRRKQ